MSKLVLRCFSNGHAHDLNIRLGSTIKTWISFFCNIIRFLPVHFEIIDIDTCNVQSRERTSSKTCLLQLAPAHPWVFREREKKLVGDSRCHHQALYIIILDPCTIHQNHTKSYLCGFGLWSRYAIPGSIWAGCFIPGIHLQPGLYWLDAKNHGYTKGPWYSTKAQNFGNVTRYSWCFKIRHGIKSPNITTISPIRFSKKQAKTNKCQAWSQIHLGTQSMCLRTSV